MRSNSLALLSSKLQGHELFKTEV